MADIFNTTTTTPEDDKTNGTNTTNTTTPSVLGDYVGEGKKYTSPEELAKGYGNADNFINQLKTEMGELRTELDKRLSAEDMVAQIKREREELNASQTTPENTTPQLDAQGVTDLISQTLDQRSTQQTADVNMAAADAKMKALYGNDKAHEVMQKKAQELNLSVEFLAGVAAKSPEAFYAVLGIADSKSTTTPAMTASTTNTEAVSKVNESVQVTVDTWNSFEALRKSDPKRYFTPAVQNKLFTARQEKGQAFYN